MRQRRQYKYKFIAGLMLKWLNFWYPLKIKLRGDTLIQNKSYVITYNQGKTFIIHKAFITQEMIDDLQNFKSIDVNAELENILMEELKKIGSII